MVSFIAMPLECPLYCHAIRRVSSLSKRRLGICEKKRSLLSKGEASTVLWTIGSSFCA